MVGYWRSASEQRSGGIFLTRAGKLAPVIEIDSPEGEAAVREAYPWENPSFVRSPGNLSSYWAKPKLAPAVQVDTPEEERRLKRDYPYDHPRFFETWKGERAVGSLTDMKGEVPVAILVAVAAAGIGWAGWKRVKSPWGVILLGMSGSMLGAVAYDLIKTFER